MNLTSKSHHDHSQARALVHCPHAKACTDVCSVARPSWGLSPRLRSCGPRCSAAGTSAAPGHSAGGKGCSNYRGSSCKRNREFCREHGGQHSSRTDASGRGFSNCHRRRHGLHRKCRQRSLERNKGCAYCTKVSCGCSLLPCRLLAGLSRTKLENSRDALLHLHA